MPEIETTRLRFRILNPQDLDAVLLLVGDPQVMKFLGAEAGVVMSREEAKVILDGMIAFWARHGFGRWAVVNKENGKLIGLCGFRLLEKMPELFYIFAEAVWGKGLATEAARAILCYGFKELGFQRIVAATRPGNTASIKVLIKIGMRYEKEISHSGIKAVRYAATHDEYQPADLPYTLS